MGVSQDEPTRQVEPPAIAVVDSEGATPIRRRGAADVEPPRRIDRFTVLERVGSGGVGIVYSAYDPRLDRRVALKLLRPAGGDGSEGEDAKARFLREGKAMARLQHPNVLTVYDVGVHLDEVFLVLELVEGGSTIDEYLRARPSAWREIIAAYIAAGRGLTAAHAVGLVHRDFKPANVLVGGDGRVRVMDFGLARLAGKASPDAETPSDEDLHSTHSGATMGTPAYMAPEQHEGDTVDARADQFSFCVALYQALYGQRPFVWEDAEQLRAAVTRGEVRAPPGDSAVPGWVRRIVMRGLSRDREDRFPSMRALLAALGRDPRRRWFQALAGTGVLALAVGAGVAFDVTRDDAAVCDGGRSRLVGVWDEGRKRELEHAFAGVDADLGPRTWGRVEAVLDAYVDEWSAHHQEVCEATEIDRHQSREVMHLKMFCLERHALELEGFTLALGKPNRKTLRRAIEGAGGLSPVHVCPRGAFEAQLELAPDDAALARLTQLRVRLAEAGGLQNAGDYEGGVERARAVLTEARAMGYRAFEAEAQLRLGSLLHYAGDYEESAAVLREAGWAAEETRLDFAAAEARTLLTHVVGRHLARYEDAETWSRHAEAAINRLRPPDEGLRARLMVYRGGLARDAGDYAGAVEELARALEVRRRLMGERHAEVGYVHAELGSTYSDMDDFQAAWRHYEAAYEIHRELLGDDHPELAPDLNNLGFVALRRGDPVQAQAHFERAITLYESMKDETYPETGEVYGHLGSALAAQGKPLRASRAFRRSLEIIHAAHGEGHPSEASVLMSMGEASVAAGRTSEAREHVEAAHHIWERTFGTEHPRLGDAQALLGRIYLEAGEAERAAQAYVSALESRRKSLGDEHASVALTRLGLGEAQAAAGQPKQGLEQVELALSLQRANGASGTTTAATLFVLARVAWSMDDGQKALAAARESLSAYERANARVEAGEVRGWLDARI